MKQERIKSKIERLKDYGWACDSIELQAAISQITDIIIEQQNQINSLRRMVLDDDNGHY